jgi:hypothetical protein
MKKAETAFLLTPDFWLLYCLLHPSSLLPSACLFSYNYLGAREALNAKHPGEI